MNATTLKKLAAILLLATGAYHLVVAYTGAPPELKTGLTVFGVGFFAAGLWTWVGGRTALLVAMVLAALGLGVGGQAYFVNGGPIHLPVMFAIDAIVLVLGGLWLKQSGRA